MAERLTMTKQRLSLRWPRPPAVPEQFARVGYAIANAALMERKAGPIHRQEGHAEVWNWHMPEVPSARLDARY
jgi:hypothetical protein